MVKDENQEKRDFSIIKEGKKISKNKINQNEKESKKNSLLIYIIPLIVLIIIATIYILTQINILLIPFGILMFIVLYGGDCSSRTCPKCKKWNSVSWKKTEKRIKKYTVTKKNIVGKEIIKKIKHKYLLVGGKCKNCDCEFETEKNRIL